MAMLPQNHVRGADINRKDPDRRGKAGIESLTGDSPVGGGRSDWAVPSDGTVPTSGANDHLRIARRSYDPGYPLDSSLTYGVSEADLAYGYVREGHYVGETGMSKRGVNAPRKGGTPAYDEDVNS